VKAEKKKFSLLEPAAQAKIAYVKPYLHKENKGLGA
jgi:hypothetical protein